MSSYDVILVSWQSRGTLPRTLEALAAQTRLPHRVIVIENSGDDGVGRVVRKVFPSAHVEISPENIGYAGGMKRGLEISTAPFVLALNPDARPAPDYAERLTSLLAGEKSAAMSQGMLWTIRSGRRVIDSLGHIRYATHDFANLGAGMEATHAEAVELLEVHRKFLLGVTGAAGMYRRAALDELEAVTRAPAFDADFGSFLEDADLGLRLTSAGWKTLVDPDALCRHDRGQNYRSVRNRFSDVRVSLQRNRYRLMVKNDPFAQVARNLMPILAWEFLWAAAHARTPFTWIRGVAGGLRGFPDALHSRRPVASALVPIPLRALPRRRRPPPDLPPISEAARVIDAVVVAYRNVNTAAEACSRLLRDSAVATVTLVDADGGSSGPVDPRALRVVPPENRGYSAAANEGADQGTAPIVLIANADAVVTEPLAPLLRHFREPRTALVAPRLLNADGSLQASTHGDLSLLKVWGQAHPRLRALADPLLRRVSARGRGVAASFWRHDQVRGVEAVAGAFFLIRRDVWEEIGGMDEGYFLWHEDADLCRRLRALGYRIIFDPKVSVVHHLGASREKNPDSERHRAASRKRYGGRHWGWVARILLGLSNRFETNHR